MKNRPNIVLVGFMGTGKTAVGKMLATDLDMTFVDMDEAIVKKNGKSIPEIFAQDGEERFRQLERQLCVELSGESGMVIATGGGIVLNPLNIRDFSESGLVICLKASPETILKRVETDTNRPLLAGNKMKKIKKILSDRNELYSSIPESIDTDQLSLREVCDYVCKLYKKKH
ncbi:MAG: shikimate kinase [Verrucomicrobiota bacterium]